MSTWMLMGLVACGGSPEPSPEASVDAANSAEAPPAEETAPAEEADATKAAIPTVAERTVTVGDGVKVLPVYHGTLRIQHGDLTVWVDPWSKADVAQGPKASVLLLTDIHPDHLDLPAIAQVRTDSTQVVAPKAVVDALAAEEDGFTPGTVLANGETATVEGIEITAVPMYNLKRGPEEGQLFHDKGRGNGYLLKIGGATVYIAGDTACTDEMKALTGIDLALVPMNLPYTMPPEEAAECVKAFRPKQVVPYHYAGSDLDVFAKALEGESDITVTIKEAYPGGLPW